MLTFENILPVLFPLAALWDPMMAVSKHGGMLRSINITTSFSDPVLFTVEMGEPGEQGFLYQIIKNVCSLW